MADFAHTTQRNRDIITAVSVPDTNPGIPVLVLSKCNIRSIFRQFQRIAVIARGGPVGLTILFDKVKFSYLVGNVVPVRPYHNHTTPIFGERCSLSATPLRAY